MLLDKAMQEEADQNWADAVVAVNYNDVDNKANIIDSHVVCKIKVEEGSKRMKACLRPHGNRHKFKI